jgi:diketogulonate reductase-like aldo/keto reductase
MKQFEDINRRQFIKLSTAMGSCILLPEMAHAETATIQKTIAKTGETIPVIGLGTSRTFNAGGNPELLAKLAQVTQTFFDMGGGMIDSSPMYGSAQQVLGELLSKVEGDRNLFAATKVWINGRQAGIDQMQESRRLWGIKNFDLMQIHNLIDWQTHLETLKQMKADGKIRYIGITTSHGRYHGELGKILKTEDFDFVQLSYNIGNRDVESNLLPIAKDHGIAVIVNRPYQRGQLFRKVKGKSLPPWTQEFDCHSWGQFFLKFAVSHPAVTCAIPATRKVKHLKDNMLAGQGRLPTAEQRERMISFFEGL